MPDLPIHHPGFLTAYIVASGDQTPLRTTRGAGSLGAGIRAYLASESHLSMASSSRVRWRRSLDDIDERYGTVTFRSLRDKHIKTALADYAPHPANNRLKVWRSLCRWALEVDLIDHNPAVSVPPRKTPSTDGHTPWNRDDIAEFRKYWAIGTQERLALEIMFWTGARISDAVRFGPAMIGKDGWLEFRQEKTGGDVAMPFFAAAPGFAEQSDNLNQAINSTPRHLVFMTTGAGKPRDAKAASQWFSTATRVAGIDGKTAHGLRKLRAIIMAENGATPHQIGAWTGHETLAEVQRYAAKANRRRTISGTESSNSSGLVPTLRPK